jgi:hypothetical protein
MMRTRCFLAVAGILAGLFVAGAAAPAGAQASLATVTIVVAEPSGSFASGFCLQPGALVYGSFTCSDGSPQYVDFVGGGGSTTRTLGPGSYTAALGSLSTGTVGPSGTVTLTAGQSATCTFSLSSPPSCADSPPPPRATVVVSVDGPLGDHATGFCLAPGLPVLGSTVCSDGSSANVDFLGPGGTAVRSLAAGTYNAGIASLSPLASGPSGPVTLGADEVLACTFSMTVAPVCAPLDANGDGIADGDQPQVASAVAADGRSLVTVAGASAEYPVTDLVTAGLPAAPSPPAPMPLGLLGFTVTLPAGATTADVEIHLPAGTNPTGYVKLRAGAWVDVTSSATIVGDVVRLHLVDNDALDTNPNVGVIGDPGGPVVANVPPSTDACKRGGWPSYTDATGRHFRNQGDCVSYVATGGRNPARG